LAGRILLVCWFVFGGLFVVLRALLPMVGEQREWLEAELARESGLPVSIARLGVDWSGLRPRLHLGGIAVHDHGGRAVLQLEQIDATLAWSSLLHWEPRFHRLEIIGPDLALGRTRDGVFTVAGLRVGAGGKSTAGSNEGGSLIAWLLEQQRVVVRNASLSWHDELRAAPPLALHDVQFVFERGLIRHRFALRARPPVELASALDIRGELRRFSVDDPAAIAGRLYVDLASADLGGWSQWVDYPVPLAGRGGLQLWLENDGAGTVVADADVVLDKVAAQLGEDLPALNLAHLRGEFRFRRAPGINEVSARNLVMASNAAGKNVAPEGGDFRFQLRQAPDGTVSGGSLSASVLDLAGLVQLAGTLPLPANVREQLAAFAPHGRIRAFELSWDGAADAPQAWTLNAGFEQLGLSAQGKIPGLGGLSGSITGNRDAGRIHLDGENTYIDLPAVFEQSRLALARFKADASWRRDGERLELALDSANFANEDAAGNATGRYWLTPDSPGEIDLSAQLTRADGSAVWRYLPKVVGQGTYAWVKNAVQRGKVSDTRLRLKGNLADFPFRDGRGEFLVAIQVSDARLDYAPGWPAIEGIEGEVRFAGPALTIEASRGRILGAQLAQVKVAIPELANGRMSIAGQARGQGADFIRFINESPLAKILADTTSALEVEGNGQIQLQLMMPLAKPDATEVTGLYRFSNNRIRFPGDWPAIENASGDLRFTADTLTIPALHARILDEPMTISATTSAAGRVEFKASGQTSAAAVRQWLGWPWLAALDGSTAWQAELSLDHGEKAFAVHAALDGVHSRLPAPFAREAGTAGPLSLKGNTAPDKPLRLEGKLGEHLEAVLERDEDGAWRGGIGLNQPAKMAHKGVELAASFDELNVDAWRRVLDRDEEGPHHDSTLPLTRIVMDAQHMQAFGQHFSAFNLRAIAGTEGWSMRIDSDHAAGALVWQHDGDGMLVARLQRLRLENGESSTGDEDAAPALRSLPGLDVQVEKFALGELDLGQIELRAHNQGKLWRLEHFSITHPHAQVSGSGQWTPGTTPRTDLDFVLSTSNIGKFLRALGYPDAVKGGIATLEGQLNWRGAPIHIDYPSLAGRLGLAATNGQFAQLEPGMGRLLGVLSLQALPRRITLDFRDVFSQGFVFDRIAGKVAVDNGVMRTDGIHIEGPAAKILMRGEADLGAETQNLSVGVQPVMTESLAIVAAAGLVNPVAGAVTYIGQKVLGDPIEKLFAYEYKITGSWVDPVVEKVRSTAATVLPGRE
jgi:uncharacterized protein (TIGR02099 family)